MINRVCFSCDEYVSESWTLILRDDKEKVEFAGHKSCVDSLESRFKEIKGREKMSLDKILKQLNLKR